MGKIPKKIFSSPKINFLKNSFASWSPKWLPRAKLGGKIGYPEQTLEPKMVTQNKPRSKNWLTQNKPGSQKWLTRTNLGAKIGYPKQT